jgi:superfamily II DNA/RNA helicase
VKSRQGGILKKSPVNQVSERILHHQKKFALVQEDQDFEHLKELNPAERESLTFGNMGLHPLLVQGLELGLGFQKPSEVQALVISRVLSQSSQNKDTLVASETGSGKTLAYMVPLFQTLKIQEEKVLNATSTDEVLIQHTLEAVMPDGQLVSSTAGLPSIRKLGRPRAIVMVPSRELVHQIASVAKALSHHCKLRVMGIHSRTRPSHVKKALKSAPVDLLVSTPGALQEHLKSSTLGLNQLQFMVLDEADTLFDRGFQEDVSKILKAASGSAKKNGNALRTLFVSATLPKSLLTTLKTDYPNLERLATPGLHRGVKGVHQYFLKLDSSTTKHNLLLEVLKQDVVRDPRILIFCNTKKSCEQVYVFLKSKGYNVSNLSSSTTLKNREELLNEFRKEGNVQKDGCQIMVATDLASRGIDTTSCRHVILFDFPHTTIDYLHRAGRVGRMGRKGKVTAFVGRKDRKLADSIEIALRRKQFLSQ